MIVGLELGEHFGRVGREGWWFSWGGEFIRLWRMGWGWGCGASGLNSSIG